MERFSLDEGHNQVGEVTHLRTRKNLRTRLPNSCGGEKKREPHTRYDTHTYICTSKSHSMESMFWCSLQAAQLSVWS